MKIVLQNKKTGQFLKSSGTWTTSIKEAADFATGRDALQFCRTHGLRSYVTLTILGSDHQVRLADCDHREKTNVEPPVTVQHQGQ